MKLTEKEKKIVEDNHHLIYFYVKLRKINPEENYHDLAIALCNAAKYYDSNKGTFSNFAIKCMDNRLLTSKKLSNGKKFIPKDKLFNYDDVSEIVDFAPKSEHTESMVIEDMILQQKVDAICKQLNNEKDKEVLLLLLKGYDMVQISKLYNVSKQAIFNRVKRIRKIVIDEQLLEKYKSEGDENENN